MTASVKKTLHMIVDSNISMPIFSEEMHEPCNEGVHQVADSLGGEMYLGTSEERPGDVTDMHALVSTGCRPARVRHTRCKRSTY